MAAWKKTTKEHSGSSMAGRPVYGRRKGASEAGVLGRHGAARSLSTPESNMRLKRNVPARPVMVGNTTEGSRYPSGLSDASLHNKFL